MPKGILFLATLMALASIFVEQTALQKAASAHR